MLTQLPKHVIELIADNIIGDDVFVESEDMPEHVVECNSLARDVLALGVCVGTRFDMQLLRLHSRTMADVLCDIEETYRISHKIVNTNDHSIVHKEFVELQCHNIHVGKHGGRSIDTNKVEVLLDYMDLCPEVYRNRISFLSLGSSSHHVDCQDRIDNHIAAILQVYIHENGDIDGPLEHIEIIEGFTSMWRIPHAREKMFYRLVHANRMM